MVVVPAKIELLPLPFAAGLPVLAGAGKGAFDPPAPTVTGKGEAVNVMADPPFKGDVE
jgi:hypothetical protein